MNSFEKPYDENKKNYDKSVGEVSDFFMNHLKDGLFDKREEYFDDGEKERVERLKERLTELLEKATKRIGYKVDGEKLINDAYRHILDLKNSGELPENNLLENFCAEIEERLEKAV
ncbi:MAG: hypothetical protein WCJ57_00865 [Candidatus Falkowbacteria bacterium]